jgi:hypothetical protein
MLITGSSLDPVLTHMSCGGFAFLQLLVHLAPRMVAFPTFNTRDLVTVKPIKLKFWEPRKGRTYTAYVHVSSLEQGISGAQIYNMAPLEQRAGCFQEMILSPRVLRFAGSQ